MTTVKYIAVIRAGKSHVLTVRDGGISGELRSTRLRSTNPPSSANTAASAPPTAPPSSPNAAGGDWRRGSQHHEQQAKAMLELRQSPQPTQHRPVPSGQSDAILKSSPSRPLLGAKPTFASFKNFIAVSWRRQREGQRISPCTHKSGMARCSTSVFPHSDHPADMPDGPSWVRNEPRSEVPSRNLERRTLFG
jgi:hypothetical protein